MIHLFHHPLPVFSEKVKVKEHRNIFLETVGLGLFHI